MSPLVSVQLEPQPSRLKSFTWREIVPTLGFQFQLPAQWPVSVPLNTSCRDVLRRCWVQSGTDGDWRPDFSTQVMTNLWFTICTGSSVNSFLTICIWTLDMYKSQSTTTHISPHSLSVHIIHNIATPPLGSRRSIRSTSSAVYRRGQCAGPSLLYRRVHRCQSWQLPGGCSIVTCSTAALQHAAPRRALAALLAGAVRG